MSNDTSNRVLTPSQTTRALEHAIQKQRPVFMSGPPGVGKSDIVHQIGEKMNAHVIDVRLSLWDPTDIKGIPYFDPTQNRMVWGAPAELPDEEMSEKYESIILFLDEMNSAPPAVQAAAYQLVLNRKVGTYQLPDNVYIVAAGNRDSDKGVTFRMPAPLANRFIHIEMKHDFDDWFKWAVDNKIHKDVVGYLTFSKKDLYDFDPKTSSRSFATPRSWSFVSELLEDDLDEETATNLISGTVGEGLAVKFIAHRKVSADMPNPQDILEGKVNEMKNHEVSAMYSLTIAMCYELKEDNEKNDPEFNNKVNNFLTFMMDNFDTEMVIMGIKLALGQYSLPINPGKTPCFERFHKEYGRYVHAAQGM